MVVLACVASSCAARTAPAPPLPTATNHPEFRYPAVPEGTDERLVTRIERGWRFLQADNYRHAEREFQAALKQQPAFSPAEAGLGYLELARRDAKDAVARFDRALQVTPAYVPALVGRGRALLELGRDADALASFEAALGADPTLTDLNSRIQVLRFRAQQASLSRAKAASDAGRWDEARAAYAEAIAASPDSAFLHRDLATVERRAGRPDEALGHFRKAVALDPADARSLVQIAEILEERDDVPGALEAYDRAAAIDGSTAAPERAARLRERLELAKLPEEFRAIPAAPAVTRGDVAALVGVRLSGLLQRARQRQAVVTDARGHWAQPWILPVVRSGVMDTQPNYTFQPTARIRRGDLALVVSRVLALIGVERPGQGAAWRDARVTIADVSPTHLSYPAVSQAVASGVMPLAADGTFQLLRPVTGAEVDEIIGRLEALASGP